MRCLGYITTGCCNEKYYVKAIEFHTPGEHAFEDSTGHAGLYPMEMLIVHQKEGSVGLKDLFIVSVPFQIKRTPGGNGFLNTINWSRVPTSQGDRVVIDTPVNLADLKYSLDGDYFVYTGSMTRPPCAENVQWRVLVQPQGMSEDQYKLIKNTFVDSKTGVGNNRPIQPRNDREIVFFRAHSFTTPRDKLIQFESNKYKWVRTCMTEATSC